jgi:hemerythrin superfamily protein
MDALQVLKADHDVVRDLFEQFNKAKENEETSRLGELQRTIFRELEVHTGIEEDVFYPEAKEVGGEAEELISEGVEEHHVVKVLMQEIEQLEPSDETFVAKMTVLIENVEHHAEEEESELFPKLRKAFGNERLEAMGDKLQEAKQRRGAQPVPESAVLKELTRDELYERASKLDIPGRSEMTKEQLVEAIANAT